MSKKSILIGLVIMSVTALSANEAMALWGWGGGPAWSMKGSVQLSGAGNLEKGNQVVVATTDLNIELLCSGPIGQVKPGTSFHPDVSQIVYLGPDDLYGKGKGCAYFYFPFDDTNEEICQSSNNPHYHWEPIEHSGLVWSYVVNTKWFACNGEELDGQQVSSLPDVADDPCYECGVDENGIFVPDPAGECSNVYWTYKRLKDEKNFECTLPLVDEQGNPYEYRDENYQVIVDPAPSNYFCCELDKQGDIIEDTCDYWPADCSAYQ
jgi:hypothetical protein